MSALTGADCLPETCNSIPDNEVCAVGCRDVTVGGVTSQACVCQGGNCNDEKRDLLQTRSSGGGGGDDDSGSAAGGANLMAMLLPLLLLLAAVRDFF